MSNKRDRKKCPVDLAITSTYLRMAQLKAIEDLRLK
jgi:hypothetical protein